MLYSENQWVIAHTYKKWSNTMLKSPVLSVPVQRALAGSAVTGGADQSSATSIGWGHVSEGADQANFSSWAHWGPSEG